MRKTIGLAALARSGKDTVASMLLKHKGVAAYALADPLKIGCQALFGLSDDETWNDEIKEDQISLWGRSPREFFQHVGTDWMRALNEDHWLMRADREINPTNPTPSSIFIEADIHDKLAPFKLAAQAFFDLANDQIWIKDKMSVKDEFWGLSPEQMIEQLESNALSDFPDYYERRIKRPIELPSRGVSALGDNNTVIIKDIRFENEAAFLRKHNGEIWHVIRKDAQKVNEHSSEFGIAIDKNDIVIDNNGTIEQLAKNVEAVWEEYLNRIESDK